MGPAAGAVIEIISDDEREDPFAANPTADALEWASSLLLDDLTGLGEGLDDSAVIQELLSTLEGEKKAADDDDDCVILDDDPDKPLVVVKEEKPGKDGAEEELQVVSEKGEVLISCLHFLYVITSRSDSYIVVGLYVRFIDRLLRSRSYIVVFVVTCHHILSSSLLDILLFES